MDGLVNAYPLSLLETEVHQPRTPILPSKLFSTKDLEKIISEEGFSKDNEDSLIRGVIGEKIALKIIKNDLEKRLPSFKEELERSLNDNVSMDVNLIQGEPGYVIKSCENYTIKLLSNNRIVVLKYSDNEEIDLDKFGYRNIGEFDGLFMFKRKIDSGKNQKHFIAVETKTGQCRLNARHAVNNILKPLSKSYNCPISYLVIGFKENLYQNTNTNQLKPHIKKFKNLVNESKFDCSFTHFPFSKSDFMNQVKGTMDILGKKIKGSAIYEASNKKMTFTNSLGETITGTFIPDTD